MAKKSASVLVRSAMAVSVLAGAMANTVVAQTNNFVMELRIVSPAVSDGGVLTNVQPGSRVPFFLEARATATSLAPGNANHGVGRANPGPAGQNAAFIQLTDSIVPSRLLRAPVGLTGTGANTGTALTGRKNPFRTGGTGASTPSNWHTRDLNGTGGALFPSGSGNAMGAFDLEGDRIFGFDCYGGGQRVGQVNPYLPFWPEVPLGVASQWYPLYAFEYEVGSTVDREVRLDASAFVSAYIQFIDLGGSFIGSLTSLPTGSRSVSTSFTFQFDGNAPTPNDPVEIGSAVWSTPAGNGNTYKIFSSPTPLTASQARSFAQRVAGRNLVSIASLAEQEFVDGLVNSVPQAFDGDGRGPWIGFRAGGSLTTSWRWPDSTAVTFTRWAGGKPSAASQVDWNAALAKNSTTTTAWTDEPASELRNTFIVEIPGCGAAGPASVVLTTAPAPVVTTSTISQVLSASSANTGVLQWRLNGQDLFGATGSPINASLASGGGFFDAYGLSACGTPVFSTAVAVSRCTTGFNAWSAESLQARLEHQIAWDSTSGRFIAFGGTLGSSMPFHFNDTLELVGQEWRPVSAAGPSGRFDHAMTEAPGGGVLLFGGRGVNGLVSNQTWLYRDGAWTSVNLPAESTPPGRGGHEMVYDAEREVVVMFGGFGEGPAFANLGDTWEFDGQTWTQRSGGPSPSARFGHSMGYDKARGRMVLHGGFGAQRLGDTWVFDGAGWQSVPGFGPSARLGASMHFDAGRQAIVLIGGSTNTQAATDQQWVFGNSGWSQIPGAFPGGAIWAHDAATSPSGQNVIAGGARGTSPLNPVASTWNGPSQAVIGTQPEPLVAGLGSESVQIRVLAYGQNLTYQWRRDGQNIENAVGTYAGATTDTLTLIGLRESQFGTYDVIVGGLCGVGEISQPAVVVRRCGLADIAREGGSAGPDGRLDNNDFIVFIDGFFSSLPASDIGAEGGVAGSDGSFDNNDFIIFIQRFFAGCE